MNLTDFSFIVALIGNLFPKSSGNNQAKRISETDQAKVFNLWRGALFNSSSSNSSSLVTLVFLTVTYDFILFWLFWMVLMRDSFYIILD